MLQAWALETSVLQIAHKVNGTYPSSYLMDAADTFTEGKVAPERDDDNSRLSSA